MTQHHSLPAIKTGSAKNRKDIEDWIDKQAKGLAGEAADAIAGGLAELLRSYLPQPIRPWFCFQVKPCGWIVGSLDGEEVDLDSFLPWEHFEENVAGYDPDVLGALILKLEK